MKNVRSLANWPPDPGRAFLGRGYRTPSSEEAKVARVNPRLKDRLVTFVGVFQGQEHTYDFEAPSEGSAKKLRELIAENVGKSVFEIGSLDLDDAA
ncbi:MAG: hypothetical protein ABSA78_13055 [Candidatus Sulfotelmatobacter sp.]|jgi:hypothetical protein